MSSSGESHKLFAAPTDDLTGLPLPLLNPYQGEYPDVYEKPNWHHAYHPEKSPILTGDDAGRALRACRLQLVNFKMHTDYHKIFSGPPLPTEPDQQFSQVVLAAAGYMPNQALTLDAHGRPYIVDIDDNDREYLWGRNNLKMQSNDTIKRFIRSYVLDQDFSHVSRRVVDEFINSNNQTRKIELGYMLLSMGASQATEQVKDDYKEAHKSAMLPPGRAEKASKFVLSVLGLRKYRENTFKELRRSLVAYG